MNTWMEKITVEGECAREGCDDPVEVDTVAVRVGKRGHAVTFHAVCWLALATDMVTFGPRPGRRRLDLDEVSRVRRLSILRKYAALGQRIKRYSDRLALEPGSEMLRLRILRQHITRAEYRVQMEGLGGVPRSWEEDPLLVQDAS